MAMTGAEVHGDLPRPAYGRGGGGVHFKHGFPGEPTSPHRPNPSSPVHLLRPTLRNYEYYKGLSYAIMRILKKGNPGQFTCGKAREKTSGTSETPGNGTTKDHREVFDDPLPPLHDSTAALT